MKRLKLLFILGFVTYSQIPIIDTLFLDEYGYRFTIPGGETYLFIAVTIFFLMGGRMEPVTELIKSIGMITGILGTMGVWTVFGILAYGIVYRLRKTFTS